MPPGPCTAGDMGAWAEARPLVKHAQARQVANITAAMADDRRVLFTFSAPCCGGGSSLTGAFLPSVRLARATLSVDQKRLSGRGVFCPLVRFP